MKDLTELRCSKCRILIGALGQMHDKKPYCYNCAHKLGYWKPLQTYDVIRIINGVTVNDPTRRRRMRFDRHGQSNSDRKNASNPNLGHAINKKHSFKAKVSLQSKSGGK